MNKMFEEIVKKVTREIAVAPYMDTVLLNLVQQGYWSEITIDYFPNKNVINLNGKPYAIVHHGRILEKDLFAHGVDFNTIEYVKPSIEYLMLVKGVWNGDKCFDVGFTNDQKKLYSMKMNQQHFVEDYW